MDLLTFLRRQWDRVAAWVCFGVGALMLLLGWLGVSDALLATQQLPYILSGGLAGACLIGVGATLWLSADLRDEWAELHEINRRLEAAEAPADEPLPVVGADDNGSASTTRRARRDRQTAPRRE